MRLGAAAAAAVECREFAANERRENDEHDDITTTMMRDVMTTRFSCAIHRGAEIGIERAGRSLSSSQTVSQRGKFAYQNGSRLACAR